MIKTVLKVSFLLLLLAVLIWIGFYSGVIKIAPKNVSFDQERSAILNRLHSIGKIELMNYNSNEIIKDTLIKQAKADSSVKTKMPVLFSINYEASACVDFGGITEKDISQQDSSIIILVPLPTICNTKINNDSLQIYNSNLTEKDLNPEVINRSDEKIQKLLDSESFKTFLINKAKTNLNKILLPLLKGVTDKSIKIMFKNPL